MSGFDLNQVFQTAVMCYRAGRLAEAENYCGQILIMDPRWEQALHLCGLIAHTTGRLRDSVHCLGRAAILAPADSDVLGNLGEALRISGRLEEAAACFQRSLQMRQDQPHVLSNLANALTDLGRFGEALSAARRAIEYQPAYANAHNNLGNLLQVRRQPALAAASLARALVLNPDFFAAYHNLGNAQILIVRLDEARSNLERALSLSPSSDETLNSLASLYSWLGMTAEALAAFQRSRELAPQRADTHSNLILSLQYHRGEDAEAVREECLRWNSNHARPLAPFRRALANDCSATRRLRIGYVSADFRDHPVGLNLFPLFAAHNRREFEIIAYSNLAEPDRLTAELRGHVDGWREIFGQADEKVAELIRADAIDILVDLALHSSKNRLRVFALKPAPVQVSFAGYPGGTGLETIDYHITDPWLEPASPEAETGPDAPYRLPDTFWCIDPRAADLPVSSLPASARGFVTFGCLNNPCKVSPLVLGLWTRVLQTVDDSRFLVMCNEGNHRQRIRAAFAEAGIDAKRIEFVGRQSRRDYLSTYGRIDLGLDTFPYNGHTTSLDAYWMGVPVVTLVGPTAVSRAGWSQLSNLGLTELAAHRPEDFVRIAAEMAGDLPRLAALRAGLRERMQRSPLMDGPRFARAVEDAYRTMWRRWCDRATSSEAPKANGPAG